MKKIKSLKEILEGKTLDEIISYYKKRMTYEVGKAKLLGNVEALLGEGYTPLQISKKLNIPEVRAERFAHDIQKLKK